MEAVAATGAQVACTANPGCMLQLEQGARQQGLPVRVAHVVDLLDEAYRQEEARAAPQAAGHTAGAS